MPTSDPSHLELSVSVRGEDFAGFVVIDTLVDGRSAGGVRITEDLMVEEVRELAREMSQKFALFHLPRGGAKAGIQISSSLDPDRRLGALRDFGRRIAPLIHRGLYYPGMDLNCGPEELRNIYRGAGIELGEITDTSFFTALSIFHCLEAVARLLPPQELPLRLGVEGFGSVARHLAERLDPSRFRIAAVSTIEGAVLAEEGFDPRDLARRKLESGDAFVRDLPGTPVERAELLIAPVDILLPSSRIWVIDPELARNLSASIVLPIANAPYAQGSLEILRERGIVCLPGYMSNVGGVLASSLFDLGLSMEEIEDCFATDYREVVRGILELARSGNRPVTEITDELAALHREGRRPFLRRSLRDRLVERFLTPRMPRRTRARAARADFQQRLAAIRAEIAQMAASR